MKVSGGLSGFARRTASYAIVSHFIQIDIHWHSGTLNTYKIDCLPFVCCSVLFYVYIVCTYACFVEPTMCSIAVSNTFFFGTHFFSRKDCWCSSNTITVEHITLSHFSCFFVCLYIHLMLKIVSEICFELANWYLAKLIFDSSSWIHEDFDRSNNCETPIHDLFDFLRSIIETKSFCV